MSFENILAWLTGADGGAFLLVSWAVSWGLEGTAFWEKLSSQAKALIILVVAGLLGAVAAALQSNPALVATLEPYLRPLIYAVLAWLGTQVPHRATKVFKAKLEQAKASTVEAAAAKVSAKAETVQAKAQVEQAEVLAVVKADQVIEDGGKDG